MRKKKEVLLAVGIVALFVGTSIGGYAYFTKPSSDNCSPTRFEYTITEIPVVIPNSRPTVIEAWGTQTSIKFEQNFTSYGMDGCLVANISKQDQKITINTIWNCSGYCFCTERYCLNGTIQPLAKGTYIICFRFINKALEGKSYLGNRTVTVG